MNQFELAEKEQQLAKRNQELQRKRKAIEDQLRRLNEGYVEETEDNEFTQDLHNRLGQSIHQQSDQDNNQKEGQNEQSKHKDIIGEIESVRKAEQQRNQTKLNQLRKTYDNNLAKLSHNKEQLQRLESTIEQAEHSLKQKNEKKKSLEGKGMKISEESKKFIADIARLNDKLEELKGVLGGLTKEEEMLKGQYAAAERRRMELSKEKNCYEIEQKNIIGKNEALKLQIDNVKQMLKDKEIASKEITLREQKVKERSQAAQKRAQRQKQQLIKAYKKLNQYIALLRKTSTHLQTANSLDFQLKDYLQAIDKADIII